MKALLVESDAGLRTQLLRALEGEGFSVVEVRDGSAAVAAVRLSAPDVVVLDLSLPDLPGLDVLGALRRGGAEAIVLGAGADQQEDRDVGLSLGAGGAVDKPVQDADLVAEVRRALAG